MIKTILFDLDGTLADTAEDMVAALNQWLAIRNQPAVAFAVARNLCSMGSRGLLSIRGIGTEQWQSAVADYLVEYEKTAYQRTVLFPQVATMLMQLQQRGYTVGIVTNKPRRYAKPILEDILHIEQYGIQTIICGDDCTHAKPHPMSLLKAAELCHCTPDQCVYVGDDVRDGEAAMASGMGFIGVLWGYWQHGQWGEDPSADTSSVPLVNAIISTPSLILTAIT